MTCFRQNERPRADEQRKGFVMRPLGKKACPSSMKEPEAAILPVGAKTEEHRKLLRKEHKFTASRTGEQQAREKRRHAKVRANIYKADRHYIPIEYNAAISGR